MPSALLALMSFFSAGVLAAGAPGTGDADAVVADALADAVRARHLEPLAPIRMQTTGRKAIERYISRQMRRTGSGGELAATAAALAAFGVLDAGYDLEGQLKKIAADQVAGYYDWERKTLYVADWVPAAMQKPTLVHEVTHALQDQHFGIGRFMAPLRGCSEPLGAVGALLEGDATVTMMDAASGRGMSGRIARAVASVTERLSLVTALMSGMGSVPRVIRESLLFPYVRGTALVAGVRDHGGWDAVDALYGVPPLSTEQILHPESLQTPAASPQDVRFPALSPGPGWRYLGTDILGELTIRLVLEESLEGAQAEAAASGWGGDRFASWRKGRAGPVLVVWASAWDTEADSVEAEAALRQMRSPPTRLERQGDRIVGVWGATPPEAARLAGVAFAGFASTTIPDFEGWRKACPSR